MCVRTYHMRSNYLMYIVAMLPYVSQLGRLLCVATMSSVALLKGQDDHLEVEETYTHDDTRLTECGMPEAISYLWCLQSC